MSELERLATDAVQFARDEITTYGLPSMFHLDLSLDKGRWLAEKMGANVSLVEAGIALMDVKLGEAFKNGVQNQHVKLSFDATEKFLTQYNIEEDSIKVLLNAVEAHHGTIPYVAIESEICANADCYRFVHPKGVLYYLTTLAKRYNNFQTEIDQIETKLKEKIAIASIPIVKDELSDYFNTFMRFIDLCRK